MAIPVGTNLQIATTAYTALVTWQTDILSDSTVNFGLPGASCQVQGNVRDGSFVLNHSILITNLLEETTYCFVVDFLDERGDAGIPLTGQATTKTDITPQRLLDKDANKIPVNLRASAGNGFVNLNWDLPINPTGISGYNIYRAFTNDLSFNGIATVTGLNYTDRSIENNREYFYTVTSFYSGSVVNPSYLPLNITSAILGEFSPPRIRLTWESPAQIVTGYRIWRSTNFNGVFSGVATTTVTTYTDENLSTNLPYYYRITSLF